MAQAVLDQGEKLTASTGGQVKDDAQQKENISLSQYEDGNSVRLDPHGLPLSPQPSQWKDDPLVGATLPTLLDDELCIDLRHRTGLGRGNGPSYYK